MRWLWLPTLILLGGIAFWLSRPQRLLALEFARQRRRAHAHVHRVTLPVGQIAYLRAGQGHATPLLYVHGFTGMKENWLPLMADMGRDCVQFAPDLPGWGESERREGDDPGYAAQADRLAAFVDAVIGAPVDVIGHSMGGGIAAVFAARYPQKVRRLVLMDAAGVRFADNAFGQAVLDGGNPFGVADVAALRRYLALVFERPPWVPGSVARWLVRQRIADAAFERSVLDSIGRSDDAFLPEREAHRITAPTLLLWCRGDRVVDASAAEIYAAQISGSRVALLDGTGHMPMMECRPATVAALQEFLA